MKDIIGLACVFAVAVVVVIAMIDRYRQFRRIRDAWFAENTTAREIGAFKIIPKNKRHKLREGETLWVSNLPWKITDVVEVKPGVFKVKAWRNEV